MKLYSKILYILTAISLTVFLSLSSMNLWAQGTLRAGIARVDITPDQPVRMSGYAGRTALSEGIHDRLFVRAIAFESSGKRLVMVSTDLVGWGDAYAFLQKPLLTQFSLKPEELLMGTTHTHSGPTATLKTETTHPNNIAYTEGLRAKLAKVIGDALNSMVPVNLAVGSGTSPVGACRRVLKPDGSSREGGRSLDRNPYGPADKEVLVVKVVRQDGSPLAAIFNFATHNTSQGPKNLQISGDVLGTAEAFVEKILGANTLAPVFVGAAGDIDPWYRVLPGFNNEPGWIPETVLLGTLLGEEVVTVFRNARELSPSSEIKTAITTIEVPGKKSQSLEIGKDSSLKTSITLTAARIGDAVFVTVPGGVATEIGMAIKAGSPYKNTLVITECNDKAGYIPMAYQYNQGGYEVFTSRCGPEAADMVVKAALKLLYGL